MPGEIELEVVASTAVLLRDKIKDFYIPAYYGEAGVLSHHLPYLSILKTGELSYLDLADFRHYFFIEGGFMEVKDNKIVLIVDGLEWGDELDPDALQKQLSETRARIQSSFKGGITPEELAKELDKQRILSLKLDIVRKAKAVKKG